ncbi:MAG TPA: chromate efflux transporter [Candidatus Limnocylindrales bacterium]|nr:chromate efflux transporter [Candidatus Limnocylindrales bacterium]
MTPERGETTSLSEIAQVFLKLGTIAFGGPAAHIALMEEEFVRRRGWLTRQEFLDRLGAANLIPGPSSTEMAIHIGFARRGWKGLVVAGVCFIFPAALIVGLLAAAYVSYGSLPQIEGVLYGIKPVVVAIVAQACWKLARTAVKSVILFSIAVLAAVLYAFNINTVGILILAAFLATGPLLFKVHHTPVLPALATWFTPSRLLSTSALVVASTGARFSLLRLFGTFLKTGAALFGSGYVLLAFLRADFVLRLRWLTEKQLLDAISVGQFTPGPVFTTATFIGYVIAGVPGAIVSTIGIFLPGFFLVAASGPIVRNVRRHPIAAAAFDGVNVASLALMAVVAIQLGKAAVVDPITAVIAAVTLVMLLRTRINPAWPIAGGAVLGVIKSLF